MFRLKTQWSGVLALLGLATLVSAGIDLSKPRRDGHPQLDQEESEGCKVANGLHPIPVKFVDGKIEATPGDYCANGCRGGVFKYVTFPGIAEGNIENEAVYYDCEGSCKEVPGQPGRITCE